MIRDLTLVNASSIVGLVAILTLVGNGTVKFIHLVLGNKQATNSVTKVCKRTILTERPPLVREI
jgi:hypothetical protein